MNNLFNILGGNSPLGGIGSFMKQLQQFRHTFQGDPRQQVQMLLNSGKVTQSQYDNAVKMTNEIMKMMR